MKNLLILLLLLSTLLGANAQDLPATKAGYYSWIYLKDSSRAMKGVIVEANDSSVQFIDKSFLTRGKVMASYKLRVIPISTIQTIKYRKRNSPGKGALLGAVGGALAGAILGYASGDDRCEPGTWCIFVYSAEEKATMGAVLGILPGLGIGTILGSRRETIHINGDQSTYNLIRNELKKYSLTGN